MREKLKILSETLKQNPAIKERLERLTFGCYFITEENRKIQIRFKTLLNKNDILEIGIKEIIGHEPQYSDILEYLGYNYSIDYKSLYSDFPISGWVDNIEIKLSPGPLSEQSDETLDEIISLCMKELDSNNLKTTIHKVCRECGEEASKLTWEKKFPNAEELERYSFIVSTFHENTCDFCGEIKYVTQARDFFYPDFNLLKNKLGEN